MSEFYLRLEQIRAENGYTTEILAKITETEERIEIKRTEIEESNILYLEEYAASLAELLDLDTLSAEQRIIVQEQLNDASQRLSIARVNQQIEQNKRETKSLQDEEAERERIRKIALESQKAGLDITSSIASSASQLLGEQTAAGKTAAVASATVDTYKAANSAYASLAGIPIVGPGLGAAAASAAIIAGVANVKKILSVDTSSANASTTDISTTPSVTPVIPTIPDIEPYYRMDEPVSTSLESTENQILNQRVYIVESDIEESTYSSRVRIEKSTF